MVGSLLAVGQWKMRALTLPALGQGGVPFSKRCTCVPEEGYLATSLRRYHIFILSAGFLWMTCMGPGEWA